LANLWQNNGKLLFGKILFELHPLPFIGEAGVVSLLLPEVIVISIT
jgi:hypothetical protein